MLAEFALIVPVLVVLLFGILEVGLAISQAQAIEAAAREAGRLASLSSTTEADVQARVDASLASFPPDGPITVSIEPETCADREGESVTVRVVAPHDISIPLVMDRTITMTGEAIFRCEA